MKGFIKVCLITALIFVIVGVIILVVAVAGGLSYTTLRLLEKEGKLQYGPFELQLGDHFISGFSVSYGDERDTSGFSAMLDGTEYHSLYLELDTADFKIYPSEDEHYYLESACDTLIIDDTAEELRISSAEESTDGSVLGEMETVLYVPDEAVFDVIEITAYAGEVEIETALTAKTVRIDVSVGEIEIAQTLLADEIYLTAGIGTIEGDGEICAHQAMYLSVTTGNLEFYDLICEGKLDVACGTGNVEIEGCAYDDVTVKNEVGNVVMYLDSDTRVCGYEIHKGLGNVSVNGFDYSGLDQTIHLDGDAGAPTITLINGLGNLEFERRNSA